MHLLLLLCINLIKQQNIIFFLYFRGEDLVSTQTSDKDGSPMLTLKKVSTNEYSVSVLSLEFCENVLRMAGDQKLMEVRGCLEGIILKIQDF